MTRVCDNCGQLESPGKRCAADRDGIHVYATATIKTMDADQLKETEVAYRAASEQAEKLRSQRNELVRQALAEGWTHAQISEAAGLSRGRIGQIAQTGERKS